MEQINRNLARNQNWTLRSNDGGKTVESEDARLAVLMDIRDELQKLNRLLGCHNCLAIPNLLRDIKKNTTKKKKKRKAVANG